MFAIPLLYRFAAPNDLRQLISSTRPHSTFLDHATLNELADDDLYLLSLCQDSTISKPHDPNPHKLKGPMKDTLLLSATHDTMSPALQFHFAWRFLSPSDRVNTVKAWPAVMRPYARLHRKAASSPLQALRQKRPAVPNVRPLCKRRAKLMACALLHFNLYTETSFAG